LRVFAKIADCHVTGATEQCSYFAGNVIVVYMQCLSFAVARTYFGFVAYSAQTFLLVQHLLIFLFTQAVIAQQCLATAVGAVIAFISGSRRYSSFLAGLCGHGGACTSFFFSRTGSARSVFGNANDSFVVASDANRLLDIRTRQASLIATFLIFAIGRALFGSSVRPLLATRFAPTFATKAVSKLAYEIFIVSVLAIVWGLFIHAQRLSSFVAYNKVAPTT